jgi:hypothetical protein
MAAYQRLTVAQWWHTLYGRNANERHYHTILVRRDHTCARIYMLARVLQKTVETGHFAGVSGSGETRTRTGDTTIFSRLPSTGECGRFAAESRARPRSPYSRGFPQFRCDCSPLRHTIANLCPNDVGDPAACPRASGVPRDRAEPTSGIEPPRKRSRRRPQDGATSRSPESATRRVRERWRWCLPVASSKAALGPAATHSGTSMIGAHSRTRTTADPAATCSGPRRTNASSDTRTAARSRHRRTVGAPSTSTAARRRC